MGADQKVRHRIYSAGFQILRAFLLAVHIERHLIRRRLSRFHEHKVLPRIRARAAAHRDVRCRNVSYILAVLSIQQRPSVSRLLQDDGFHRAILRRGIVHPQADRKISAARIQTGSHRHLCALTLPFPKPQDISEPLLL